MTIEHDPSSKSDGEIKTWIANHQRLGVTDTPLFRALVEERARRFGRGLTIEASLAHLIAAAKARKLATSRSVAEANGVSWNKARLAMSGEGRYLDQLLDICHARGLPLLPSLCVRPRDEDVGDAALNGFVNGVRRLGYEVADPEAFLRQCQEECFAWASTAS